MMNNDRKEIENKKISQAKGKELAKEFQLNNQGDPFPKIPPSLLSADHIKQYVMATGAISPFDPSEENGLLKKATYEGRIGDSAYEYNDREELVSLPKENDLLIRANSIVFVECDLDFRLPNFLALRFNLQIRHVHRGLLLGTGPIIDPGYWGKLCIPLHNLTNEDYSIPRSEGLIWIEFTKTSGGDTTIGRTPFDNCKDGYWDIRDLIRKAARSYNIENKSVAIRSSIPSTATAAKVASEEAKIRAEKAEKHARKIEENVGNIRSLYRNTSIIGVIVAIAAIIGILFTSYTLISGIFSNIQNTHEVVISKAEPRIDEDITNNNGQKIDSVDIELRKMAREIKKLQKKIQDLENSASSPE